MNLHTVSATFWKNLRLSNDNMDLHDTVCAVRPLRDLLPAFPMSQTELGTAAAWKAMGEFSQTQAPKSTTVVKGLE